MSAASFPLPVTRDLFYDGRWHKPLGGYARTFDPATQRDLGAVADADHDDVDAAVRSAHAAFAAWRETTPTERGAMLRKLADKVRANAAEFAYLDALNCGNPIRELEADARIAAAQLDYFAGLVHEIKGDTLPLGPGALNYSVREPLGVVARIVAYNHPLMFLAGKLAPAVAAGNTVVMKPAEQAPLSSYRLAELAADVFPPGVVNFITGGRACGEALVAHPLVRKVALIGAVPTGVAILKAAAEKVMPVTLELGGKNPLIVYPDADIDKAIAGAVAGMNFGWAGQSCGSTTRCFVHRSVYDRVVAGIAELVPQRHRCGTPTDPATTMGCLISEAHFRKVIGYIDSARNEGARLVCGGRRPAAPELAQGWFVEATVFADVTPTMRIYREEIFGPVLSVLPWDDEEEMLGNVNGLDLGLTASVWTRDLATAHRAARRIEAGYVWINKTSAHFLGADFGGYKRSGIGREEGLRELLDYTQLKNIHVALQ